MQPSKELHFQCKKCEKEVGFSLDNLDKEIICPSCLQKYHFNDEILKNQLVKFVKLCQTIKDAEDILAQTCVGIDVGDEHVEIPYKLLLTRLNTSLDLEIDGKPFKITFRMEPIEKLLKM